MSNYRLPIATDPVVFFTYFNAKEYPLLQVKIICVGRLKEPFFAQACQEYTKRLRRFVKLVIIEVNDEKAPEHYSAQQIQQVNEKEGQRILKHVVPDDYVIALCIDGKSYDSEGWAHHIDSLLLQGKSRLCFLIGGSNGLHDSVIARADERLSFSSFTFCHQLMRVILFEQLYRAMKIRVNEPYHK